MGTWDTKIQGNDTFQDVYQQFIDLYNKGKDPIEASIQILEDNAELFQEPDDRYNAYFGLAFAQWETKSLDRKVFNLVKEIIESGLDLQVWETLGADTKTLNKRKTTLEAFLSKISKPKEKAKPRSIQEIQITRKVVINSTSFDFSKTCEVAEVYVNGIYKSTQAQMIRSNGLRSGVFSFYGEAKYIAIEWIDNQNMQVLYDEDVAFYIKNETDQLIKDIVQIVYRQRSDVL